MSNPIPLILHCPQCNYKHIDKEEFATTKIHHTHACQNCGLVWRPAIEPTVGVEFLPGYKDNNQLTEEEKLRALKAIAIEWYDDWSIDPKSVMDKRLFDLIRKLFK